MTIITKISNGFSRWIDAVTEAVCSLMDRFRAQRHFEIIENDDASLTLHATGSAKEPELADLRIDAQNGHVSESLPPSWAAALRGSRIEIVLPPARFLFRPLELPRRAAEFLDGIIRAQIDRLTPWTANEAFYKWTAPTEIANDRIHVLIAATARTIAERYLQLAANLGATSIAISTIPQGIDGNAARITVFEQRAHAGSEIGRIRRLLLVIFFACSVTATASIGISTYIGANLDAEQQEFSNKIAQRRIAIRANQGAEGRSPRRMLEIRKQSTPSSVIVLEALSQILPDHTYVTEIRMEGDKLQVVGITQDAPSLIQLIEQSPHFARATFFAPTTRASNDPGERFHIETRVKPHFPTGT